MIGILLLGSCVFGGGSDVEPDAAAEAKAAPAVSAGPVAKSATAEALPAPTVDAEVEQAEHAVAALINLNGHLCAKPVDVRPLTVKQGTFEVTCIEYRGGSGKVRYLVDASSGTAAPL